MLDTCSVQNASNTDEVALESQHTGGTNAFPLGVWWWNKETMRPVCNFPWLGSVLWNFRFG